MSTVGDTDPVSGVGASIHRRRFLTIGLGAGVTGALGVAVATGLGSAGSAAASTPSTEGLWQLNPSWGFALAGSGRCECNCTACVRHGANKVFFGRAAAETGRAHPGCACIAEPFTGTVDAAALRQLSTDGRSVDRRDPAVAAVFDSAAGASTRPAEVSA